MIKATIGDLILTWIAFILITLISQSKEWIIKPWGRKQILSMLIIGLFLSLLIENYAISIGRWSYTSINPLLPFTNISIIPILQLLILFPLSFSISGIILRKINIITF